MFSSPSRLCCMRYQLGLRCRDDQVYLRSIISWSSVERSPGNRTFSIYSKHKMALAGYRTKEEERQAQSLQLKQEIKKAETEAKEKLEAARQKSIRRERRKVPDSKMRMEDREISDHLRRVHSPSASAPPVSSRHYFRTEPLSAPSPPRVLEQQQPAAAARGGQRESDERGGRSVRTDPYYTEDVQWRWQEQPQLAEKSVQRLLRVAMIGTTNAGKSQLMNCLINTKVSAVTNKRNTTRREVIGVSTHDDAQLIFYDTPGINPPAQAKQEWRDLATTAWQCLQDVHLGLMVIDASQEISDAELYVLKQLKEAHSQLPELQLHLVLNKVDRVEPKKQLLTLTERLWPMCDFEECWMVSALTGDGVGDIERTLLGLAPAGEWEFEADVVTDQSPRQVVEEVVREKIFLRLNQETPYDVRLKTLAWTKWPNGSVRVDLQLTVASVGQKKQVIGRGAEVLQHIMSNAQRDLEKILGYKVIIYAHVVVGKSSSALEADEPLAEALAAN
eukprot:gb/GEZN01006902.1/.p1 GENE.gb/GEZN01006902.1/~~gb/GEZN01006902.1/.p1  ORF type:complete len:503 (-),score=63.86 gb/GEZN01006902.1/:60-1568(-)